MEVSKIDTSLNLIHLEKAVIGKYEYFSTQGHIHLQVLRN